MTAFDSAIIDAVESVITRFTPPGQARPAVSVNVRCNPEKARPEGPCNNPSPHFDGPPESITPDNYDLDTDLEADAQCSAPANAPCCNTFRQGCTMKVGDQVQLRGFKQIFTIFKLLPSSKEVKLFRIDAADEHKTLVVPAEAIIGFGR